MTRSLLINAQVPESLRVAIIEDSVLDHYQIENAQKGLTRGNIYRGTIASVQPSLNAAFIDYGAKRNGFLAIQDVVEDAYYGTPTAGQRPRIDEVLEPGKPIVVQVVKEAVGEKGAALTTNLSLAGRYLVLTPFSSTRGVSRKVEDQEIRASLKEVVSKLVLPDGAGAIVRTNALDQTKTTLQRDLNALLRLWTRVSTSARQGDEASKLLYSDQDLVLQTLRDYLDSSIDEVLIDDDAAFQKSQDYRKAFMPRSKTRISRYFDRRPLFDRHNLEAQIACIYDRRVPLPSGGSLVIDPTEALTSIDVNSGRSTSASTQEETALNTNVEAAAEAGRQLRLRDIGGLVVVDFIDMRMFKNRRAIEKAMRAALKNDKARATVGRISANGLLEINRQRIQQALNLRTHQECPHCGGTGRVPSADLVASKMLRELESKIAKGSIKAAIVRLQTDAAAEIQNRRRAELTRMEREHETEIDIFGSDTLRPDEYEFSWTRRDPASRGAARSQPQQTRRADSADSNSDSKPKPKKTRAKSRSKSTGKSKTAAKEESKEESKEAPATAETEAKTPTSPARKRRSRRPARSRTRAAKDEQQTEDAEAKTAASDKPASDKPPGDTQAKTTSRRSSSKSRSVRTPKKKASQVPSGPPPVPPLSASGPAAGSTRPSPSASASPAATAPPKPAAESASQSAPVPSKETVFPPKPPESS